MNKKILIAIPLCLIGFQGTSQETAQDGCRQIAVPPVCQDGRRININNAGHTMGPPNICVSTGEIITVDVTPNGTTASIIGKSGGWPQGSGSTFMITAPEPGAYEYKVIFEDGSCIDPRITVKR